MRGSKLYYFLIDLDRSELEDLKAFVDSPFFNKKEGPRLLLDYLLQIPGPLSEHEPALEEEAIFSALYPDRPFKAGVYNHLFLFLRSCNTCTCSTLSRLDQPINPCTTHHLGSCNVFLLEPP